MSTIVEQIAAASAGHGLALTRSSPRGTDRLLLEFRDQDGSLVAGQWHRDPELGDQLAQRLARSCPPGSLAALPGAGVVLQRDGADRKLPALAELVAEGSVLVAHRAERRGVVRRPDGDYTKVVRPEKTAEVAAGSATAPGTGEVALPQLLDVDHDRGLVTTRALPGQTLEARLVDPSVSDADVAADAAAVGAALRAFHEAPPPYGERRPHDVAAEVAVTRDWLRLADEYRLVPSGWEPTLARAADEPAGAATVPVRVHRDLHDKQIVLAAGHPVGLLDLDLTTAGEAALDLANLVTHLQLRHLQGRCSADRAARCAAAFLDAYRPDTATSARIAGYAATTRLRLAAVYAFRDSHPGLVEQLLSTTAAPTT